MRDRPQADYLEELAGGREALAEHMRMAAITKTDQSRIRNGSGRVDPGGSNIRTPGSFVAPLLLRLGGYDPERVEALWPGALRALAEAPPGVVLGRELRRMRLAAGVSEADAGMAMVLTEWWFKRRDPVKLCREVESGGCPVVSGDGVIAWAHTCKATVSDHQSVMALRSAADFGWFDLPADSNHGRRRDIDWRIMAAGGGPLTISDFDGVAVFTDRQQQRDRVSKRLLVYGYTSSGRQDGQWAVADG